MDTLAHGLWATAAAKAINVREPRTLKTGQMALWSIVPDLFSFIPVIVWMIWQMSYNGVAFSDIPRPEFMTAVERDKIFILRLSQILYHISHSIVIFLGLFILTWLFRRYQSGRTAEYSFGGGRPYFEMTGWLLHILLDIPTHSDKLYPTPFLWPLSGYYFNGSSWGTMRFMLGNYLCLLAAFIVLRLAGRRSARKMKVKA